MKEQANKTQGSGAMDKPKADEEVFLSVLDAAWEGFGAVSALAQKVAYGELPSSDIILQFGEAGEIGKWIADAKQYGEFAWILAPLAACAEGLKIILFDAYAQGASAMQFRARRFVAQVQKNMGAVRNLEKRMFRWVQSKAEARIAEKMAEIQDLAAAREIAEDAKKRAEAERDGMRYAVEALRLSYDGLKTELRSLRGHKRGLSSDAARLDAFKRFETAMKDEAGTQVDIARGVLEELKAEDGIDLHLDPRTFLNRWRDWTQLKRPGTVEEYRAAKDAAKKAKRAKTAKPAKAKGKRGAGRRGL